MTDLDPWGIAARRQSRTRVRAAVAACALVAASGVGLLAHEAGWGCVKAQLQWALWTSSACVPAEVGEP
jgi:hypothetical protein